jgi:hypothetical protein
MTLGKINMPKISKKISVSLKPNRSLSVMKGIALGEQALHAGRVHSQAEAKRRFARWLSSVKHLHET